MSENKKIKIYIVVDEGIVNEIYASVPRNELEVEVLDFDDPSLDAEEEKALQRKYDTLKQKNFLY